MAISAVNSKYQFDSTQCVVSLLCTELFESRTPFGHAVIIVEMMKNKELFVGQYELLCFKPLEKDYRYFQSLINNDQGRVTVIRSREGNKYYKNEKKNIDTEKLYTESPSKSWYAKPEDVQKMIDTIEKDIKEVVEGCKNATFPKFYQSYGSSRCHIFGGNGGDNCVTWANKMMAIAKVGNGVKLLESSAPALPLVHVYPTMTKLIITTITISISFFVKRYWK